MIDFNYDGNVLSPSISDIPEKNKLVNGKYKIPLGAKKIKIKITDLLSESLEKEIDLWIIRIQLIFSSLNYYKTFI